jgi:hypothetical protein
MALESQAVKLAWTMPLAMPVTKTWGAFALSVTITGVAMRRAARAGITWVVQSVDPGAVALNVTVSKVVLLWEIPWQSGIIDAVDAGKPDIPNTMFGILMDHYSDSINA